MARTEETTMTRVVSRDGTEIAYWTNGEGPPLVLVHGTTADHTRWAPCRHAWSRTTPSTRWTGEAEVTAATEPTTTGAGVRGRRCRGRRRDRDLRIRGRRARPLVRRALRVRCGDADLERPQAGAVPGVACLEPRGHPSGESGAAGRVARRGGPRALLERMFREVVRMPEYEFEGYSALPAWQARIAARTRSPVRPGGKRANLRSRGGEEDHGASAAHGRWRQPDIIKADCETVAAALPDARITVMEGQQHIAIDLIPEVFAGTCSRSCAETPTTSLHEQATTLSVDPAQIGAESWARAHRARLWPHRRRAPADHPATRGYRQPHRARHRVHLATSTDVIQRPSGPRSATRLLLRWLRRGSRSRRSELANCEQHTGMPGRRVCSATS